MGYDVFHLDNIRPIVRNQKKINKVSCRDVFIVGDRAYKIIKDGLPDIFLDIMQSGFYRVTAPILEGVIFKDEKAVGYVAKKCTTLNVGRIQTQQIREILAREYARTNYVFNDFHSQNLGQYNGQVTILDLESVSADLFTKDSEYSRMIQDCFKFKWSIDAL